MVALKNDSNFFYKYELVAFTMATRKQLNICIKYSQQRACCLGKPFLFSLTKKII